MLNLNLKKKETLFQNAETDTLSLFYVNGTGKLNKEFRFAKIDSHFGAFLPYLTDGAVKLYLHYAFAANSNTGESWHSMDTISRELGTTERSIGNWNRSLEDLGLIYRTRNKKKSKTTFILPLTGFAVNMGKQQMGQILDELKLRRPGEYDRVFGAFSQMIKLYVKTEADDRVNEVLCMHLKRSCWWKNTEIIHMDIFIYDATVNHDPDLIQKLLQTPRGQITAVVKEKSEISLGKEVFPNVSCFFINQIAAVDNASVFNLMSQLTDNIELSELPVISL